MSWAKHSLLSCLSLFISSTFFGQSDSLKDEDYRPMIHFTPKEKWMNDPNGMVYYKKVYHLFYQYHPYSSVWGPMHWGHATSKDIIHWNREPVKIFPDSNGTIFSGSAVIDKNNTSGFGKNGEAPLVAIFTQHKEETYKAGAKDFQNQSIAYSLDNGNTWVKYDKNPVLRSPGIPDFRDPKVMWHGPSKKWIMTLAVFDRVHFYSSHDLKNWSKESEFGESFGEHGGVWECPDLFPMNYSGKQVWILIVNLNPGGPNKGSATQYFIGDFDGKVFKPYNAKTKWLDYGPDEYAGVTWSNTGNRKIFLGWMTNWMYAQAVPTETWRSAMTIPRELKVTKVNDDFLIASIPVKEINKIKTKPDVFKDISLAEKFDLSQNVEHLDFPAILELTFDEINDLSIVLSNDLNEELVIGYEKEQNHYFIDRTKSGKITFNEGFAARHYAPRFVNDPKTRITLIIDVSSIELFADKGLTVMTETFFPNRYFNRVQIRSTPSGMAKKIEYIRLNNIWEP
jgi:fructan beta-fructosidase